MSAVVNNTGFFYSHLNPLAQPCALIYTSAMELFSQPDSKESPLAFRMRPRNMEEFIGQEHIAGPGRLLRRIIQADRMSSIIFYGPPGTGKTTLARVIANTTKSSFITLNAVLDGVKNLREAIDEAVSHRDLYGRRTLLFIDEVHRWNKSQQDALLPWVENGTVILIGATTENPYFEVNKALVSRSRIFQLKQLTADDLNRIAIQAVGDSERGYGLFKVSFEEGALEHLVDTANGDARSLLNAVELAVETSVDNFPPREGSSIHVSMETAEESIQKKALLYDKEGDYHFDTISAFIKSIRGSDPDAVLYWLAVMVRAGEDPRYIFRRMLISASEDIGLADPGALGIVEAAASAFDRVGLPEGRFHLTQAALYLAAAPKSNTTLAFFDALAAVEQEAAAEVPNHLKDAGRDREGFGHGEGYLYPHAYRDHWTAQQYLPSALQGRIFYEPSDQGFEAGIRERIILRREIQLAETVPDSHPEVLTFSPPDRGREQWINKVNSESGRTLAALRERIFEGPKINRHDRLLVIESGVPVFLWEAVRRTPEGACWYLPSGQKEAEICRHYAASLPEESQPVEAAAFGNEKDVIYPLSLSELADRIPSDMTFEMIILRDQLTSAADRDGYFKKLRTMLSDGGAVRLCQFIPSMAQRLSALPELAGLKENEKDLYEAIAGSEDGIYGNSDNPLVNWGSSEIIKAAGNCGLHVDHSHFNMEEKRIIKPQELEKWLDAEGPGYGGYLSRQLSESEFSRLKELLTGALCRAPVSWKLNFLVMTAYLRTN